MTCCARLPRRFRAVFIGQATLWRSFGGEEFAVILPNTGGRKRATSAM